MAVEWTSVRYEMDIRTFYTETHRYVFLRLALHPLLLLPKLPLLTKHNKHGSVPRIHVSTTSRSESNVTYAAVAAKTSARLARFVIESTGKL
jgi:hypothetical protein